MAMTPGNDHHIIGRVNLETIKTGFKTFAENLARFRKSAVIGKSRSIIHNGYLKTNIRTIFCQRFGNMSPTKNNQPAF
jgi:hypothetical protein